MRQEVLSKLELLKAQEDLQGKAERSAEKADEGRGNNSEGAIDIIG
jgi:hypothetical protein